MSKTITRKQPAVHYIRVECIDDDGNFYQSDFINRMKHDDLHILFIMTTECILHDHTVTAIVGTLDGKTFDELDALLPSDALQHMRSIFIDRDYYQKRLDRLILAQ